MTLWKVTWVPYLKSLFTVSFTLRLALTGALLGGMIYFARNVNVGQQEMEKDDQSEFYTFSKMLNREDEYNRVLEDVREYKRQKGMKIRYKNE